MIRGNKVPAVLIRELLRVLFRFLEVAAKLYEIGAGTQEIRRMLIGRELYAKTA